MTDESLNNSRALAARRTEKIVQVVEAFLACPVAQGAVDSWSAKSFEEFRKNWSANPSGSSCNSRELELRAPRQGGESSGACRVSFSFKDKRSAPEPDGTITGVETLRATMSMSGLYGNYDVLSTSGMLAWFMQVADACSQAVADSGFQNESYVWCTAEQAQRAAAHQAREEAVDRITRALMKDAKGARVGSRRRFKCYDLAPGAYDEVVVSYYGGKLTRKFSVLVYPDGTGYFTRKT